MKIDCDCGYVAQAPNGEHLVAVARAHARSAHQIELTADQVLLLARDAGQLAADDEARPIRGQGSGRPVGADPVVSPRNIEGNR